jgi:hypothetical protein
MQITNLKTLNKLTNLSLVSLSLKNVTGLYQQVKKTNMLTKITFTIAEALFNTFNKIVTTPIANIFHKQSIIF